MTKKKNSPALFEAISKTRQQQKQENMAVPKWMDQRSDSGEDPVDSIETQRRFAGPLISTGAGRLVLSLDVIASLAIVSGLIVLLIAAFWLGRVTGPDSPSDPGSGGLPPVNTEVLNIAGETPNSSVPKPAVSSRILGKHYLVIESLAGFSDTDRADAGKIVGFLASQGEKADIGKTTVAGKQVYVIWSLRPMDSPTSDEAVNFAEKIESLGKQYQVQFGKYRFQQRRSPTANLEPYYLPHK